MKTVTRQHSGGDGEKQANSNAPVEPQVKPFPGKKVSFEDLVKRGVVRETKPGEFSVDSSIMTLEDSAAVVSEIIMKDRSIPGVQPMQIADTMTMFLRDFNLLKTYLDKEAKKYVMEREERGEREIRIMIAGCSSGEETYTLGVFFREVIEELYRDGRLNKQSRDAWTEGISIWGLDKSAKMLGKAKRGVYKWRPEEWTGENKRYLHMYFTIKKGDEEAVVEPYESLKARVNFGFLDVSEYDPKLINGFNFIFARNMIYQVSPKRRAQTIDRLRGSLEEDGMLFVENESSRIVILSRKGENGMAAETALTSLGLRTE